MSLTERFWDDLTPYERRLVIDEATGRTSGQVTFEFNCFDVTLDFDASLATVADVLRGDELDTTPLADNSALREPTAY